VARPADDEGRGADKGGRPLGFGRKRIASLVFAVGCGVVLMTILPRLPQDRELRVELTAPAEVTEIELTFLDAQGSPVLGRTTRYSRGSARASSTSSVRLPEGAFVLEMRVRRGDQLQELRQEVLVDGDEPIHVRF
jgi:hypothetical protein